MLTQHEVRTQLDAIANEVAQTPGLYYELYSRLFSRRVQGWIQTAPQPDARVIQHIAENDPDYLIHIDTESASINTELAELLVAQAQYPLPVNPAWDMDY
jgi:hypothetical protein